MRSKSVGKNTQKAFMYKDHLYVRVIPGKRLFNSTMVHEVVNRGDVFAVRLEDMALTIIGGTEIVSFGEFKYQVQFPLEI